jgi:hypothetical protein
VIESVHVDMFGPVPNDADAIQLKVPIYATLTTMNNGGAPVGMATSQPVQTVMNVLRNDFLLTLYETLQSTDARLNGATLVTP